MTRVAILGLDSLSPLLLQRWKDELPHLSSFMAAGSSGTLRSTDPPITVPAWTSMTTSRDPGQLGLYGFRNRRDHSYDAYDFATSGRVKVPRLWDVLGGAGYRCVVLGVPQTYPPKPLNGEMVSCFLTPGIDSRYTYPSELRDEVEKVTGGYVFDVENFRTPDKEGLLERCFDKTRRHMRLVKHMLVHHSWDFFMMVEMGVDRMHHGFWSFMDPLHSKYRAGNRFEGAMLDYYRFIDAEMGELFSLLPRDCVAIVVSDHGAKRLEGGICFNEWLIRERFLRLSSTPSEPRLLTNDMIDWESTLAWGDGGYYGRCFLNVKGREPQGTVDPNDYEKVRDELIASIAGIEDPQGHCIGSRACRPEDLYRESTGVPPDLLVYFGDLGWRSVGSVGLGSIHTLDNDTGPDEANHDWYGVIAIGGRSGAVDSFAKRLGEVAIFDVAPTVLELMGVDVPVHMIGSSLVRRGPVARRIDIA
ncbi:MAG: alkaline phosphatase family protein [Candidatus Binatia bacterium]